MIRTFGHRGLRRLYERGDRSTVRPDLVDRIETILARLDVAERVEELDLNTFRLHQLKGSSKGFWSVTVRANWRIIFRFKDGDAFNVDLVDYH